MITHPAVYFARTIAVPPSNVGGYAAWCGEYLMPVWRSMREERMLDQIDTVVLRQDLKRDEGVPHWNIVQIGRVPEGQLASAFFGREGELTGELAYGAASVLRSETLRTTPNAHHAEPAEHVRERRDDARISIECIRVVPHALERYRELMIANAGPAALELRDGGFIFNFVPLETEDVLFESAGMAGWNQLHILALLPEHTEDFVSRFSDAILRANPASGGYDGYFSELDSIRERPRWSLGRWVSSLRVPQPNETVP